MKKKKCFEYEASPYQTGKYVIRPIYDNFHLDSTNGSFNVICARLFGISYADYLRMCRDKYKAEIIGKGSLYPVAYFNLSQELFALIDQLNARANLVLWERENPDLREKVAELEKE
jgi:hypothetical protein